MVGHVDVRPVLDELESLQALASVCGHMQRCGADAIQRVRRDARLPTEREKVRREGAYTR